MALSKQNTIKVVDETIIQVFHPNIGSKQKNKSEHMEYHGIFTSFKSQVYSKHGRPTFLLLGSWSLVSYIHVR